MSNVLVAVIKLHLTKELLLIDNNECCLCGDYLAETWHTVSPHHIKSRSLGGSDKWYNLMPLCYKCHNVTEGASYSDFSRDGINRETLNAALHQVRQERIDNILKWMELDPKEISAIQDEKIIEDVADDYAKTVAYPGSNFWLPKSWNKRC